MEETYNTTDLALVSYLLMTGKSVSEVKTMGKRCAFVFNSPIDQKEITDFYDGKLTVNPLNYFLQIKNAKGMLYGHLRNEGGDY